MERRPRNKTTRYLGASRRGDREQQRVEDSQNRNSARREKYNSDVNYADGVRANSREYYRRTNPLNSKLSRGLLTEGQLREVTCDVMEVPAVVEAFTLPEAAKALGRTELTLKKWIQEELIPAPVLRDCVKGYRLYSLGELQVIAGVLGEHEAEFAYYASNHTLTRERMFQLIQGYRSMYI